ncbi:Hypothetical predicted protein [Pelobates cultripes]|uniref:Uncharacterized protein n=1 Tax=Pelobates cultripes TaxID=61616 RepID=A0AAD1TFW2_PELCU|nr:Hypothetical predicted protein [Pelobates cultripes]
MRGEQKESRRRRQCQKKAKKKRLEQEGQRGGQVFPPLHPGHWAEALVPDLQTLDPLIIPVETNFESQTSAIYPDLSARLPYIHWLSAHVGKEPFVNASRHSSAIPISPIMWDQRAADIAGRIIKPRLSGAAEQGLRLAISWRAENGRPDRFSLLYVGHLECWTPFRWLVHRYSLVETNTGPQGTTQLAKESSTQKRITQLQLSMGMFTGNFSIVNKFQVSVDTGKEPLRMCPF